MDAGGGVPDGAVPMDGGSPDANELVDEPLPLGRVVLNCGAGTYVVNPVTGILRFISDYTGPTAISPNGRRLAIELRGFGLGANQVEIYDLATLKVTGTFVGQPLAWVDDATLLAGVDAGSGAVAKLVGLNGQVTGPDLKVPAPSTSASPFSPDRKRVAIQQTNSSPRMIMVVSLATGAVVAQHSLDFTANLAPSPPVWTKGNKLVYAGPAPSDRLFVSDPDVPANTVEHTVSSGPSGILQIRDWPGADRLWVGYDQKHEVLSATTGLADPYPAWIAGKGYWQLYASSDEKRVLAMLFPSDLKVLDTNGAHAAAISKPTQCSLMSTPVQWSLTR